MSAGDAAPTWSTSVPWKTFVPASNGADQVAIPYTGYGEGGTSYTGTLYITLGPQPHRLAPLSGLADGGGLPHRAGGGDVDDHLAGEGVPRRELCHL